MGMDTRIHNIMGMGIPRQRNVYGILRVQIQYIRGFSLPYSGLAHTSHAGIFRSFLCCQGQEPTLQMAQDVYCLGCGTYSN